MVRRFVQSGFWEISLPFTDLRQSAASDAVGLTYNSFIHSCSHFLFLFIVQCYYSGGNKRFRDLVAAAVEGYNEASTRLEKATVVNGIVEEIRAAGGRFLRHDEEAGTWHGKS